MTKMLSEIKNGEAKSIPHIFETKIISEVETDDGTKAIPNNSETKIVSEIEDEEIRPIPQEKYDLVVWTPHEELFRYRNVLRNKVLAEIAVPFTIALQVKLRRSVFGTYLNDLNENQCQSEFINMNKLGIMDSIMDAFKPKQVTLFDYNNNLFDEVIQYLKNTVTETEQIDCKFLYEHATHLRLDEYHINMVDDGVRNFQNLQVLVICGNWITDIDGSILPRRLKFLELYVNEIQSVDNLTHKAPKHLQHLGLARNKLTNDSHLHLLAACKRFKSLKSLDLSECDIYRLVDVLVDLQPLQNLEGLLLQGNPCSMVMGYKDIVLNAFPYLIFLDGTEILKPDRTLTENFMKGAKNAELILSCSKLVGLQKPPKLPKADKKVKQTIHIEFTVPLFQLDTKEDVEESDDSDGDKSKETKGKKKGKKGKKGKSQKTSKKSSKSASKKTSKKRSKKGSSKKSKKSKKSPYERPNEYNPKKINNSFQTQRKPGTNNMKFPPLLLKSPENNLVAHRDTFRSCVNVRVVYLQYLPPAKKKKKGKGSKKGKKKKGKSKKSSSKKSDKKSNKSKGKKKKNKSDKSSKSKKSSKKTERSEEKLKPKKPEKEPKEKILKRVTVADFNCNLFTMNWKDNIHFYWSEDPSFGNDAVELYGYLEDLRKKAEKEKREKLEKLKAKKKKKAGKKDKKSKKSKDKKSKKDKKSGKSKSSKSKKSKKSKKTKKTKKSKKSKKSKRSKSSKKSKGDKYLTCEVSFGLSRVGRKIEEFSTGSSKKRKKKKKGKGKKKKQ